MKKLFLLLAFVVTIAHAQDVIVKRDGSIIQSKVTEVNSNEIKYKKFSNPDGPVYIICKAEVLAINYENGDKDTFSEQTSVAASKPTMTRQQPIPDEERNKELLMLYNREYAGMIWGNRKPIQPGNVS